MPTAEAQHYSDLCQDYLRKARVHLAEGDLTQASEKGWGAAAEQVKAAAEARGLNHSTHRQLWRAMQLLAAESDDPELRRLFGFAGELQINFYEAWLDPDTVEDYLSHVERLVRKLEALA